jgi:hypothetical protein
MPILWIVDHNSPHDAFSALPPDSNENIIIHMEPTTRDLASQVQRRVRVSVTTARIVSHGNSGQLNFVTGVVNASNVNLFHFLRGLVTRMIEIHGCGVASDFLPPPRFVPGIGNAGTYHYGNMQGQLTGLWNPGRGEAMASTAFRASRGAEFLQRMADVCGVAVIGGVDYQLPDSRWGYEGPTITVYPGRNRRSVLTDPQGRYGLGPTFFF